MTFTVAIVGRPNVGKSTLFNRMVGKKLALVHDTPGLTRDWRGAEARLDGQTFRLLDTAGLEESFDASIAARMRQQTERALAEADFILFVVDARQGLTPMDKHFADFLRKRKLPVALIANKCENEKAAMGMHEAWELGFGAPIPVSAEHGRGMEELYNVLRPRLKKAGPEATEESSEENLDKLFEMYEEGAETGFGDEEAEAEDLEKPIRVAIVGRPNAGKSTLLNAFLGEERSMTGPEAGITRDAVHADWDFGGRKLQLVDTAGLRKKAKIVGDIEKMSVDDTLRAIRLAQVVILVIDAEEEFSHQDLAIAGHIVNEGRAIVIAANKWDKVKAKAEKLEELQYQVEKGMAQVKDVPIVTLSALNGKRVDDVLKASLEVYDLWNSRVPTGKLNRWLRMMESRNPAPLVNGRPNRLRYMTQVKARPPTFAIWVSRADDYPEAHQRYIVNGLRKDFEIPAVPVRLLVKTSKNPYAD